MESVRVSDPHRFRRRTRRNDPSETAPPRPAIRRPHIDQIALNFIHAKKEDAADVTRAADVDLRALLDAFFRPVWSFLSKAPRQRELLGTIIGGANGTHYNARMRATANQRTPNGTDLADLIQCDHHGLPTDADGITVLRYHATMAILARIADILDWQMSRRRAHAQRCAA